MIRTMGRRPKRDGPSGSDDLLDLLSEAPTWLGPVLAAAVFLLLRFLLPTVLPGRSSGFDASPLLQPLFSTLAWVLAGLVLVVWVNPIELADGTALAQLVAAVQAPAAAPAMTAATLTTPTQNRAPAPAPRCPACGATMLLRTARRGPTPGSQFWGCPRYPACLGTRPAD